MNTTLNLLSVPKDSAASTESTSGNLTSGSTTERQDLAGSGEKNATFARVLKGESQQDSGKTGGNATDRPQKLAGEASASKDSGKAVAKETAANTSKLSSELATAEKSAVAAELDVAGLDANEGIEELSTIAQPDQDAETDTALAALHTGQADEAKERTQINIQSSLVLRESIARVLKGESRAATTPTVATTGTVDVVSGNAFEAGSKSSIAAGSDPRSAIASTELAAEDMESGNEAKATETGGTKTATSSLLSDSTQKSDLATVTATTSATAATLAANPLQGTAADSSNQQGRQSEPMQLATSLVNTPDTTMTASENRTLENVRQAFANAMTGTQSGAQTEEAVAAGTNPELNNTKANSISLTANLESFPAAGKPLPPTGKSLPAGLFFQGDSEAPTLTRAEQPTQATQPVDLNSAYAGKPVAANQNISMQQNFSQDFEFSGDRLMRSMLSATNSVAESLPPAATIPSAPDNTIATPPLTNPLLQVTADKALQAARGFLTLGSEPALNLNIAAQAGSAEWQSQLSGRIRWMGNLNISSAELKLHPAELGAVEIQISTEDDQTRVSFITSNAAAKEVIESTLPRLRELLSEGGLQLEQSDVAQRDLSDGRQTRELSNGEHTEHEENEDAEIQQANLHFTRKSTSQIDHYV